MSKHGSISIYSNPSVLPSWLSRIKQKKSYRGWGMNDYYYYYFLLLLFYSTKPRGQVTISIYRYWPDAVIKIKFPCGARKNNKDSQIDHFFRVQFYSIWDLLTHSAAGFLLFWNSTNIKTNINFCFLSCWRKKQTQPLREKWPISQRTPIWLPKKAGPLTYSRFFCRVTTKITFSSRYWVCTFI